MNDQKLVIKRKASGKHDTSINKSDHDLLIMDHLNSIGEPLGILEIMLINEKNQQRLIELKKTHVVDKVISRITDHKTIRAYFNSHRFIVELSEWYIKNHPLVKTPTLLQLTKEITDAHIALSKGDSIDPKIIELRRILKTHASELFETTKGQEWWRTQLTIKK